MNYNSSDFLSINPKSSLSFLNEFLNNEVLLCYRLFKIYEKSPIFNVLEQEFNLYMDEKEELENYFFSSKKCACWIGTFNCNFQCFPPSLVPMMPPAPEIHTCC